MADSVDKDKFDAVLKRLIAAQPQTEYQTRMRAMAERSHKRQTAAMRKATKASAKRKNSE